MNHGDYVRFKGSYLAAFSRSEYRGKIGRVISNQELIPCGLVGVKILINGKQLQCCVDDIEVVDDPNGRQNDSLCALLSEPPRD